MLEGLLRGHGGFDRPSVAGAFSSALRTNARRARGGEMEVEPRVAQQPCLYGWGLVRGGVVQHDVHFEVIGHSLVDLGEESLELLGSVTPASGGDHLACSDIEGCEQIGDPVSHIVVCPALHLAGSHRQDRLCPIERLDAVFSSTQHTTACSGGFI